MSKRPRENSAVTKYWLKHYASGHCTLCGNRGWIDSRGVTTPVGVQVGQLNWCICPNGQALRNQSGMQRPPSDEMPIRREVMAGMNDHEACGCMGCPYVGPGLWKCPCGADCRCKCKMQPEELRVEVYTQGKDSAVRITHVPTGAVSEAMGEASQHQNRAKALKQLAEKIQLHRDQEAHR